MSGRSVGESLLRGGDAAAAVEALREDEARRPADFRVKRSLGIALLEAGSASEALIKLQESQQRRPSDHHTLYFIGRAAEALGRVDDAISAYTDYLSRTERGAAIVRDRLQGLALRKAARDVQAALAAEKSLRVDRVPPNTIAVTDFTNVARSDTLSPLGRGLAVMVLTDLAKVRELRVVERQKLGVLLDELHLAGGPTPDEASGATWAPLRSVRGVKQRLAALRRPDSGRPYFDGALDDNEDGAFRTAVRAFQADRQLAVDGAVGPKTRGALERAITEAGLAPGPAGASRPIALPSRSLIDPATAPRLGVLLGARRFVQGAFLTLADSRVQLDAAIVPVGEGNQGPVGPSRSGSLDEILRLEKALVFDILETLGIEVSRAERRAIEQIPTRKFLAFLAFSRGLVWEDAGERGAAHSAYEEAVAIDPGFALAKQRGEMMAVGAADSDALDMAMLRGATASGGGSAARLIRTGTRVGLGPGPRSDRSDDEDPGPTAATKTELPGRIVIDGDLPPRGDR